MIEIEIKQNKTLWTKTQNWLVSPISPLEIEYAAERNRCLPHSWI